MLPLSLLYGVGWGDGHIKLALRECLLNGPELAWAGPCYNALEWNSGWSESIPGPGKLGLEKSTGL